MSTANARVKVPSLMRVFTGNGTDNNWSTPGNWDSVYGPSPAVSAPSAGSDLLFFGPNRLTTNNNDLASATSIDSVHFVQGAGAFTLAGNQITLNSGITNQSGNVQTINLAIANPSGCSINTSNGDIGIGGIISGAGGLTKLGTGTLTLTGANSYAGTISISAGSISASAANNLGASTGTIDFIGNGTLVVTDSFSVASKTINCTGASRSITWDIAAGKSLTVGSMVSAGGGEGVASKNGSGTLIGTGSNSNFSCGIRVNAGKVDARAAACWGNAAGWNMYMQANTTGAITGDSNIDRNVTEHMQGNNITYISDRVTPGNGVSHTLRNVHIEGSYTVNITVGSNVTGGTQGFGSRGTVWLYGDVVFNVVKPAGANILFSLVTLTSLSTPYSATLQGTGDSAVTGIISSLTGLTMSGSGTLTLSGASTYTGATTISAGTLKLTGSLANTAVAVSGGTFTGPTTTGASATLTGTVTVSDSTSSILQPGSFGNNTLNTGALTFSGSNSRLTIDSTTTTMSKVAVTGNVALGGCGVIFNAGITTNGTYKIITASGTMSGTLPTIITNNTGKTLVLQQTGNDLEVVVS